jgi:hypothetical protein
MTPETSQPTAVPGGHVSRFILARAIATELTPEEKTKFDQHNEVCVPCRQAWERAKTEAQSFALAHPTLNQLRRAVDNRVPVSHRNRKVTQESWGDLFPARLWTGWIDAFARPRVAWAMALVVVSVGAILYSRNAALERSGADPVAREEFAAKGLAIPTKNQSIDSTQAATALYYAFVNGVAVSGDSLRARPGDTIQLGIVSSAPVYYALYYRDDGRDLLPYFSAGDSARRPIGTAQGENLPRSLVLDSLWKRETLYALSSAKPFSHAEAVERITAQETGRLPQEGPALQRFLVTGGKP